MSSQLTTRVRGRKRGIALLLLAVLVVAGSVAASELTEPAAVPGPTEVAVDEADSGSAYCPVVGAEGETAQLEIASASTTEPAEVVITRYVDGVPAAGEPRLLEAGRTAVLDIPADQVTSPLVVDWRGGPVVAQYRLADDAEEAVATCETRPSDRWHLAGFDTNRGNTSTLYLFNPFGQDAVVELRFGTAEGPVELVIAEGITVPAGGVVTRDLAEFVPETADVAVTVQADVGRVVPQGQLVRGPAGEGLEAVTGRALVPATPDVGDLLYVPDAIADDVTTSWVTIYNPEDRAAAVRTQVTTPLGTAPALAGELTVPAGGTARLDLAELSALPRLGVSLESVNGIGLVATRTTAVQDADRVGLALEEAVDTADRSWAVAGGRAPDGTVTLFNPGAEVATAQVEVAGGTPETWTAVTVPPNGLQQLPLSGLSVEGPALVTADLPLVAGVVSLSPETATAFWSASGVATSGLVGGGEAVRAEREPSLSSRPALSATATPTATPREVPGGEGQLDPSSEVPTTVAPPTELAPTELAPTEPAPTERGPTEAPATEPAPAPTGGTPTPAATAAPGPSPLPPATTEDSLFGKTRRGGRPSGG